MADLQSYYDIVEGAIQQIGIEPTQCRGQEPGSWTLYKGDIEVWIDLWEIEQGTAEQPNKLPYFQVMSPLLEIPAHVSPAFYREVLEINHKLYGVAFSIQKDRLTLKVLREADGLDQDEVYAMIVRVGNYASDYVPTLREKYISSEQPGAAPDWR